MKWSNLSDAQMNEGIRDPIKAFEYMNRYYVLEGNKRVSVLKYFNAVSIPAIVTRKIPKLSDDYDVRLYYEYMKFNEITGLCSVEFTKLGNADKLLSLVGKEGRWDDETKEKFAKVMFDFSKVYNFRGGDRLDIKLGDAITVFMEVFGMDAMLEMSENDYNKNVINTWKEFAAEGEKHKINLVLDPKKVQTKKSLLNYLIPQTPKEAQGGIFVSERAERHLRGCIRMSLGVCILMKPFLTSWRQNMWQVWMRTMWSRCLRIL